MGASSHPLFEAYPLDGEETISVGRVPTPYQTYDGVGTLIGGTADLTVIHELLREEQVYAIQTTEGRAVMAIWIADFTEASLGPHNELQLSILVSHKPTAPIETHRLTLLKALFANPDARMFCWKLWNNTEQVVAYNRELLGLDAKLNHGKIQCEGKRRSFHFIDETGELILEGHVTVAKRTAPGVGWRLFRLLGLRQTMKAFSQPYLGAKVVNPISDAVPFNGDAQSFVASDTPVVQWFDNSSDAIKFGAAEVPSIDFQPDFVEHFAPFRFVYLHPQKPA